MPIEKITDALKNKRVLVAEDEEICRRIVETVLQKCDAEIYLTKNGQEALELYLEKEDGFFDLALFDLYMPILSGDKTCQKIRESGKSDAGSLQIVGLTADLRTSEEELLEMGFDALLEKPLQYEELLRIISND
ncbi:MAG: response regulator [Lachnospiraceae bacterium]|nr:response regulator [Lachnospiraceae bacterium]